MPAPARAYAVLALVNLSIVGLYRVFLDVPFRPLERVLAAAAALSRPRDRAGQAR